MAMAWVLSEQSQWNWQLRFDTLIALAQMIPPARVRHLKGRFDIRIFLRGFNDSLYHFVRITHFKTAIKVTAVYTSIPPQTSEDDKGLGASLLKQFNATFR